MVEENKAQSVSPELLVEATGPTGPAGPRGATGPAPYIGYVSSNKPVILPVGTPARWVTLGTVASISLQSTQAVKVDASFLLSWISGDSGSTELNLEYRILRNGTIIYTGTNVYGFVENSRMVNQEFVSFFHVDTASAGSYTYTLQTRVNGYDNLQGSVEILEANMSAVVYPNQAASQQYLFVTCWNESENLLGNVSIIDTSTDTVIKKLYTGINPGAMSISPDLTTLYVADTDPVGAGYDGYNYVWVIDINNLSHKGVIQVGINPSAVLVSPDNSKVYVANADTRNVTIIDHLTKQVIATVPVGLGTPFALTAAANGSYIFVACKSSAPGSDYIAAIKTSNLQVTVFGMSYGLQFDVEANPVAVSSNSQTLVVTAKNKVLLASLYASSIGPFYSVTNESLGSTFRTGVFIDRDMGQFHQLYLIEPTPSEEFSVWPMTADNSQASWQTPVPYPSYKGQNQIAASPDQLRVCITVVASDDEFAGLQIIEPEHANASHFIRLPIARDVAITANSAKAYVSEHRYVHPVNLQTFTETPAILVNGLVQNILAAYRLQS